MSVALPNQDDPDQAAPDEPNPTAVAPPPPVDSGALPPVAPAADLARVRVHPGWLMLCFGVTFLIYVVLIPHFLLYSSPPTGDQPFYLMDVISLVQDGDLNVKNNYDNHDEAKFYALAPHPPGFVGMSAPNPIPRQLAPARTRPPTEEYSAHLAGLPLLLLPAWVVGSWFALWWPATIVMMCLIGALVAVNIFLLAVELTGRTWIAAVVWIALAFSSPLMTYSYLIFTELPTGLLLIYAFRRLALGWEANGWGRRVLIGLCIGYMPWIAWRAAPIALILLAYAAVQWWRVYRLRATPGRALPALVRSAVPLLGPVVLSAALLAAYNLFLYGRVVADTSVITEGHEVLYWPWGTPDDRVRFTSDAFGLLFDIQWGFLTYAPVYLLAAVGLIALWRRGGGPGRRVLLWLALLGLPYMAVVAAFYAWNGQWCPPARYLTTFAPLLAGPLAVSLYACRNWLYTLLYAVLAVPGFLSMAIMLNDPIRMWPFGDGRLFWGGVFDWLALSPDAPIRLDLRRVLPSFIAPDEIAQPGQTALVISIAFVIVFVGALFIRRAGPRVPFRPASLVLQSSGWLGAAAFLGVGWLIMNAAYLKPNTVLVEQHRWTLAQPLTEVHGMTYLDGKLYLTSLGPRSTVGQIQLGAGELGAFDPATGSYAAVRPISASGVLTYSYPGDVKTGPDGLLYLLNNGAGDQALYVMQPGGQVVRQVAMRGKGPIAIGFGLGPDGKLYATDMGLIHAYPAGGGDALASWGGPKGGFNNIAGVTVAPDNTVYGAETSEKRVFAFDNTGHYRQTYDLRCQPWQMVVAGDWLDIACEGGVRSLNLKTGDMQVARISPNDPPLGSPTALAYGPNDILYLFDRNTIIAYRVQH